MKKNGQFTLQGTQDLSSDYHLIADNWENSLSWHTKILDRIIMENKRSSDKKLLDCTCGIGTQILGLAEINYKVAGSDLSKKAVGRAKKEAKKRNLDINFFNSDIKELSKNVPGEFDIIISCDNVLPHLMIKENLEIADREIYDHLLDNGLFLASIRDYDSIIREKPTSIPIRNNEKRITFQLWNWYKNDEYKLEHFIILKRNGKYKTRVRKTRYKAFLRESISKIFKEIGFQDIEWLFPKESGYYQPIMICFKRDKN